MEIILIHMIVLKLQRLKQKQTDKKYQMYAMVKDLKQIIIYGNTNDFRQVYF